MKVCVKEPETERADEDVTTVLKEDSPVVIIERLVVLGSVVSEAKEEEETVPFPGTNKAVDPIVRTDVVAIEVAGVVVLPMIGTIVCVRIGDGEKVASREDDAEAFILPPELELPNQKLLD
jgi:hypothetical protein